MNTIIERVLSHGPVTVARELLPSLNESKHGDAALKQMKKYNLPVDGLNHEHIVRGIANTHGIPPMLVPQVLHHLGHHYNRPVADYEVAAHTNQWHDAMIHHARTLAEQHHKAEHPGPPLRYPHFSDYKYKNEPDDKMYDADMNAYEDREKELRAHNSKVAKTAVSLFKNMGPEPKKHKASGRALFKAYAEAGKTGSSVTGHALKVADQEAADAIPEYEKELRNKLHSTRSEGLAPSIQTVSDHVGDVENHSVDVTKDFHALMTHPKAKEALSVALKAGKEHDNVNPYHDPRHDEELPKTPEEHAASPEDVQKARNISDNVSNSFHNKSTKSLDVNDLAHAYLLHKHSKYNPLSENTWRKPVTVSGDDSVSREVVGMVGGHHNIDDDTNVHHVGHAVSEHIRMAHEYLGALQGHKIPYEPDAEHTDSKGVKYRGYSLHTPEKANDRCWGSKYCLATAGHAEQMNKMYHGGVYKPTHIITRVGEHGEHIHAAYSPEMLPGQAHANPEQAVRNSGNNGAIKGEYFKRIHPLLSKLDYRADLPNVAKHYEQE